jgi:hypothetical protein
VICSQRSEVFAPRRRENRFAASGVDRPALHVLNFLDPSIGSFTNPDNFTRRSSRENATNSAFGWPVGFITSG